MMTIADKATIQNRIQIFRNPVFAFLGLLFFSFNTYFLPHGLSVILIFGISMIPYVLFREINFRWIFVYIIFSYFVLLFFELNSFFYFKSAILFLGHISVFILFKHFLKRKENIEKWIDGFSLFSNILILLFVVLKFTSYKNLVWWTFFLSTSIGDFTRLKGFGYEPSYFAFSLVPLVLFYFSKVLSRKIKWYQVLLFLGMISGLAFAFSLGVFLGLAIAICISSLFFIYSSDFVSLNRKKLCLSIIMAIVLAFGSFIFFPESALMVRISDLINGKDLSGNSRLMDSFLLSFEIISQKSLLFGVGLGQLKVVGFQTIKDFYNYTYLDSWAPAMPNSITDWLCNFGIIGVLAKLVAEFYFFIKTQVFKDFYRFSCFVFIFIYQFTGGFLFCLPELVLWGIAFYAPNHFQFLPSAKWLAQRPLANISVFEWTIKIHQGVPFLVFASFILFSLGFFISNAVLSIASVLFLFSLGFYRSFFRKIPGILVSPIFQFQAGFFLLTLISVLWSENQSEAWIEVQSKLPFLLFPLFIQPQNPILKKAIKGLLALSFYAGILISIICLLGVILRFSSHFSLDQMTYENLSRASGLQPIYLSYFLIFSIISGYSIWKYFKISHPAFIFPGLIFLYLMVILLSSRMEIMVVFILLIAGLFHHFMMKKNRILGLGLLMFGLTLGIIFLSPTNRGRFQEMIDLKSTYSENKWGGRALRLEKWKLSIEAIKENWLIGSGAGDYWSELEKVYQKNNFELGLKEKFNSHNQYLQTALTLGFPGLVLLISIFIFMVIQARKTENFVLFISVLAIVLSLISESILERQTGIFLSVLFANLFYSLSTFLKAEEANDY